MILRPIAAAGEALPAAALSAWQAVAQMQQHAAAPCWLITQADHARVSGQIAAQMKVPGLAPPPPEALRGIALHDAGWEPLDAEALRAESLPRSFIQATPPVAARAWTGSIEQAVSDSPLAGYLVSRHFWRLGDALGEASAENNEQRRLVREFLEREAARQQELLGRASTSPEHAERLVDLLQFCDLLSLYLCCGSRQPVEFPQGAGDGRPLRLRWRDVAGPCLLEPSPFAAPVRLEASAHSFPAQRERQTTLRWDVH